GSTRPTTASGRSCATRCRWRSCCSYRPVATSSLACRSECDKQGCLSLRGLETRPVTRRLLPLGLALLCALPLAARHAPAPKHKLLIAFSSYRDRPRHPQIYFYEHDGIDKGKIIGSIPTVNNRSDYHPSLSLDGRYCAFASELENQTSRVFLWDLQEK